MRRRFICILLTVILLTGTVCPLASAAHTHTGSLVSLKTESDSSVPCCGVFRCSSCGLLFERTVTSSDVGMPVINIEGNLGGMTKENKITAKLTYDSADRSFETYTTMKWQGDSSLRYPKKNYSITFINESGSKNKIMVKPEWGKQSKYCLKANWVDLSSARNIVSAKLWGEIIHNECRDDAVDALLNGGAIDGFPVLLYNNGGFLGLYTFNTPKDKWIYGMGDGEREGLMMADGYTRSCDMYEPIADVNDPAASKWDVEYCSTDDVAWLVESLNNLINCFVNLDGQGLKNALPQYLDVERTIDYLVFITVLRAEDNRAKNIMWATYDGVKFSPLAYDLEGSWGTKWSGKLFTDNPEQYDTQTDTQFLRKMISNYADQIHARYAELRETVLSYANIERLFNEYASGIGNIVYNAEKDRWPSQPGISGNTISQCLSFAKKHLNYLDNLYGVSINEKTTQAYTAKFMCLNDTKSFVYPTGSVSGSPERAAIALSKDGSGALTKNSGQIAFCVSAPEGCKANVSVSPASAGNLIGPDQTGLDNVYRLTGISADCRIVVSAEKIAEDSGYTVAFNCPNDVRILVYPGQDYNQTPVESLSTVSVDSETGMPTKSDGQVNFKIVCNDPTSVFSVTASPKKYKKLKGYEETGVANLYRMTKISGDLTITIQKDESHQHNYTYNYAQIVNDDVVHRSYCSCGQYITEPHCYETRSETSGEYNVCSVCGYSIMKSTACSHICHSTNPILRVLWKIEVFFFKIFRIRRICECGEAHY